MKIKRMLKIVVLLAIIVPFVTYGKGKKDKEKYKLQTDSLALVTLYNECNGINWLHNENWLTGPLSTWYGVTVGTKRVVKLELFNENISPRFGLTGQIPDEIWNLDKLTVLNLSSNLITLEIPPEIENLDKLQELNLSYSGGGVGGFIPPEISYLKNLKELKIDGGQISGLPGSFGELDKLEVFSIAGNQASFDLSPLYSLKKIKEIDIRNNRFDELLAFENQHLEILNVSNNYLTFEDLIPNMDIDSIVYSPQMTVGESQSLNPVAGSELIVEFAIGGEGNSYKWLKDGELYQESENGNLVFPSISYNDAGIYTCEITNPLVPELIISSRPIIIYQSMTSTYEALAAFYQATNDEEDWIHSDNWLSESPLDEWYGISFNQNQGKYALFLAQNNLNGHIPDEFGELKGFYSLNFSNNPDLEGELPESLGNISELKQLILRNTSTTGDVPASIFQLPEIVNINISNSYFMNLPTQIEFHGGNLNVQNNNLTFEDVLPYIGQSYNFIYAPQRPVDHTEYFIPDAGTELVLTANHYEDGISYQWYFNNEALDGETGNTLTISNITDEYAGIFTYRISHPGAPGLIIESMPKYVELSGSIKSGLEALYQSTNGDNWLNNENWLSNKSIGEWYGITIDDYPDRTLIDLKLPANNLTGTIPHEIGGLYHFVKIDLSNNQISGEIPEEIGQLSETNWLILSNNLLTGEVPASIGNMENMEIIDFGGNQLTGSIPESIGNLEHLWRLSLNDNQLSGELPASLYQITRLFSIELANNQFSGAISPDILNIPELSNLEIAFNNFTSIPDLSQSSLRTLFMVRNFLRFEHIIPALQKQYDEVAYYPQKGAVDEIEYFEFDGQPVMLSANYYFEGCNYQWFRNGQIISGANAINYEANEQGGYYYQVTNPGAPGLTLASLPKFVGFNETTIRNALTAFYYSTDGDNWTNNTNWLSDAPLNEWYGINLNNGLFNLSIWANNLNGSLPDEMEDLVNFSTIRIINNPGLSGEIPASLGNCNYLQYLILRGTNITGTIPLPIFQINGMQGINIQQCMINELPELPDRYPISLVVTGNQLSFEDIVPNIGHVPNFQYIPQNTIVDQPESFSINEGESVELTANYIYPGCNYQWYKDGNSIDGATQTTFTATEAGTYYYEVTHPDVPGLIIPSASKEVIVLTNKSAKIKTDPVIENLSMTNENALTVYPNPAKNTCTIQLTCAEQTHSLIELYDSQGRKCKLIYSGESPSGSISLTEDLSSYTSGMYFIRATINNQLIIKKLIKSK